MFVYHAQISDETGPVFSGHYKTLKLAQERLAEWQAHLDDTSDWNNGRTFLMGSLYTSRIVPVRIFES